MLIGKGCWTASAESSKFALTTTSALLEAWPAECLLAYGHTCGRLPQNNVGTRASPSVGAPVLGFASSLPYSAAFLEGVDEADAPSVIRPLHQLGL